MPFPTVARPPSSPPPRKDLRRFVRNCEADLAVCAHTGGHEAIPIEARLRRGLTSDLVDTHRSAAAGCIVPTVTGYQVAVRRRSRVHSPPGRGHIWLIRWCSFRYRPLRHGRQTYRRNLQRDIANGMVNLETKEPEYAFSLKSTLRFSTCSKGLPEDPSIGLGAPRCARLSNLRV